MLILLLYLIGVVLNLLILSPEGVDAALEKTRKENPGMDQDWRPSSIQLFIASLLWPLVFLSIFFTKINK